MGRDGDGGGAGTRTAVQQWSYRVRTTRDVHRIANAVFLSPPSLTHPHPPSPTPLVILSPTEQDTDGWTVLRAHYNDDAISELPYSAAAWKLRPPKTDGQHTWADGTGFRYFLILQLGPNSSGNDCFFIGGMELYGTLTMDATLDAR